MRSRQPDNDSVLPTSLTKTLSLIDDVSEGEDLEPLPNPNYVSSLNRNRGYKQNSQLER